MTDRYPDVTERLHKRGSYRVQRVNADTELWFNPEKNRHFAVAVPLSDAHADRIIREEFDGHL